MIKLDVKDKKILQQLDLNARQSNTQIGRAVGLSHDSVNYRIKKLEKLKVIEGYYAMIDLTRIGYHHIRGWIKFHNISNEEEQNLIDFMLESRKYGFVVSVGGKYDLAFSLSIKDLYEFESRIDLLLHKYGHYVNNMDFSIGSKIYYFQNNFLYKNTTIRKYSDDGYIGRKKCVSQLDKNEIKILEILSNNARISIVQLAKKVNLTSKTILNKISKLEKNNIILAYRAKLNYSVLGYHYYKLFLLTQNLGNKTFHEMVSYANQDDNIIYLVKALAHSQIELEIITKNNSEFFGIVKKLKHRFKKIVKDYYFNQVNKEYKSVYLT